MSDVTGMLGTGNTLAANRRIDFASELLELEPSAAPLVVLSSRLGNVPTHNPEFKWAENQLENRFDAINNATGYTDAATSITVDNGSRFVANDLVKVPRTGEVMRVTAVAGNVLTVVRGVGGAGVALLDNDELYKIGIAKMEGDDISPATSRNPTTQTGYCQIFRTPFSETNTLRHSDTYTSQNNWQILANHAGIEHAKDMELAFWLGKPSENLTGTHPVRTTGGVFHYITTNVTDVGGAMTEQEFFSAFRGAFRYGGKRTKTLFAGQAFNSILDTYPRGKIQVVQGDRDTTYGLDVTRFTSSQGTLNVVNHYLLEGTVYGGYGAILDMEVIKKRYLRNSEGSRDSHIVTNRQGPGVDGRTDEHVAECGLQVGNEQRHALITNATSAA